MVTALRAVFSLDRIGECENAPPTDLGAFIPASSPGAEAGLNSKDERP